MIKLKSLFRRGQNGPSGSSKHSNNAAARNKSQSTLSLNTVAENGQQQATQRQQQQQQQQSSSQQQQVLVSSSSSAPSNKQYSNNLEIISGSSERGVDVGDSVIIGSAGGGIVGNNALLNANTLPTQKKTKAVNKKGQKQPKQLPQQQLHLQQQQQQEQQQKQNSGNVMTTIGLTPSAQNSVISNNYPEAAGVGLAVGSAPAGDYNDVYQVKNTAIAAGVALSIVNNQQQQQIQQQKQQLQQKQQQQEQQLQQQEQHFKQQHHQQQQLLLEANNKMQELQSQLDRMGHEKLVLETRISELLPYQAEVSKLNSDFLKIQSLYEKNQMEIANLKYENETLRNRLRDVVNSPLSDTEKHQIIQDSQRLHSSAPASIALPSTLENDAVVLGGSNGGNGGSSGGGGGITPCLTPDWDKHSSSSEISVACLQDKIIQMEETHYSTNEELQATLQELADLQSQLTDAQTENERLAEEKHVLFQSLCRQTEKLNESRTQITTLQELLLRDAKQAEIGTSEREKKLLDLIQTSQEERETILIKQEELNNELQELRQTLDLSNQENKRFLERISLLDSTLDAANAERKQMESQLSQAREEISQRAIEMNRLNTLLENARSKIDELEQDLARGEKTDLTELLDAARKEKDTLEERVAELQDQCSRSQAEIGRLKEQISALNEECKVAKNNAKCAVSHLEYRLEQLQQEKDKLSSDFQQLVESTNELQVQSKCHLEDKQQLQNLLSETQKHLGDVERKLKDTEEQLETEIQTRKQEAEEWQQFQSDLLISVRVANDFKTEALSEREQLVLDNKMQKEKIRMLEQQIEKLTKQQLQQNETQQSVLSTMQQEMASRRSKIGNFNRQDSRLSVKTLIESIENNKQQLKTEESESSGGNVGINTTPDIVTSATTQTSATSNNMLPLLNQNTNTNAANNDWVTDGQTRISGNNNATTTPTSINTTPPTKGLLREQQQQQQQQTNLHISSLNNVSKQLLSGERKDPLNMLAKNGGSKRNALLKWCQNKTVGYRNIDITNFSSSWNDGLAFCAILHSYLPDRIPYDTLTPTNKRRNFSLAFAAAESVGISTTLNINDMCQLERPDWMQVMSYITAIYKYFET